MWDKVGIVRTPSELDSGIRELEGMVKEAEELFEVVKSKESTGVRDASMAGLEVARAARANEVSKGTHFINMSETVEQVVVQNA
mmetsp:Transcript_3860/g.7776  ORF Transcript_3860/g.7776 Transcript_3860/m.7776 type:complete len:84 (-) Transcript_3860:66-317(-)